jgi:aspartyl-tRNA(Asn)/glutamyl-tRNA(Gln) amidotransferase subunit A
VTDSITRRTALRRAGAAGSSVWLGGLALSNAAQAAPRRHDSFRVPAPHVSGPDDIAYLTIAQASAMIEARSLSPLELVDACLARIERHDGDVKAWVALFADQARAQARAAGRRIARRGPRSPLDGIPVGIKDMFDVEGHPTRCGSKVRADAPPASRDATMVARLRAAGAILLGKTNTHEFASGGATPPTSNPWDLSRTPGGSSGGSAAALAAGMCLGATGTDTAGSIRIPAAICSVTGVKPTFGRVAKAGIFPQAGSVDHAGPLARSVEDCALLLNATVGRDPLDPTSVRAKREDFTRRLGKRVAGRRIGVPTSVFFDGVDGETARVVHDAIPVMKSLGADVVPVDVPHTQPLAAAAWLLIAAVEQYSVHEHYIRRRPQDYRPQTLAFIQAGAPWTAQQYVRAQRIRTINIREWLHVFRGVDAVLTPTVPRTAPPKTEAEVFEGFDLINYTSPFDFNGFPSISVPAGFTKTGLPVGLMLSAAPFDEARLLQLAYAYQQATRFGARRPPIGARR